jgi:Protein of unknown function (DUF3151)
MADERPITMSPGGLPSTVLPTADPRAEASLAEAVRRDAAERRDAVASVVAAYPRFLAAWAALGDAAADTIERYAAYRVGYHRGLDALRANGWRGSGYVRWAEPTNVGFLRCLLGLQQMAAAIGEHDEAARCEQFLLQLDPTGPPS